MDDLLLLVEGGHPNVLLIVEIILFGHFCLVDHLFVLASPLLLFGLSFLSE
jgi:hypothetical protein